MGDFLGWRRLAIFVLATALVAACSALQLGYRQLDRIVYWYVDDYLPLSAEQGVALKPRIARLVAWHCGSQLPAYARWLRAVHADVLAGAGPELLDGHVEQAIGFLREIGAAAAPEAATLLGEASPQQVAALFEALDKRNSDYREEWVESAPRDVARKRSKRVRSRIEGWIGDLNPAQEQALARWTAGFEATGESFLESRLRWQAALRQALERRGDAAAFGTEIRALLTRPEERWSADYLRRARVNRQLTLELLSAVAAALDEAQRAYLEREVKLVAGDLDKLACSGGAPKLGAMPAALALR